LRELEARFSVVVLLPLDYLGRRYMHKASDVYIVNESRIIPFMQSR
jgi:hypothetical protein